MKFKATSYSMGKATKSITFEAPTPMSAVNHRAINKLPASGQGERGRVRIVGIERLS